MKHDIAADDEQDSGAGSVKRLGRQGFIKSYYSILDDEKLLRVAPAYRWAHHIFTLYAGKKQTDGWVSQDAARRLIAYHDLPADCCEVLVAARLMDQGDGDYVVHDYLDHQTSSKEIEERRAKLSAIRSKAGRKGAFVKWQNAGRDGKTEYESGKPIAKPMANVQQTPGKALAERKKERNEETRTPQKSGDIAGSREPVDTARERVASLTEQQLRRKLTRERAKEIADHWTELTRKSTSAKTAAATAEFAIPMPVLLDALDRCYEAGVYSLEGCRMTLQRLESEVRKTESQRSGPSSLASRLSVLSNPDDARAKA